MSAIQSEAQSLSPSAIISLFSLDTSSIGGPALHFVMQAQSESNVVYGGITFTAIDIKFSGMETSGAGALPSPKLSIANTDGVVQSIVNGFGDLNGCILRRVRTFARFLDGRPDADAAAFFGPDVFRMDRKITDTSDTIEWDLSASIDQEGKMIPGRIAVRDTCLWRYRAWNQTTSSFDYSKAQCPYAGAQSYDINDQPVIDNSKDVPSRRVGCCEARFGAGQPLPFGGFPGMARNV